MPITINGSGTVTGISAGGLPDASITADELASGAVTQVKLASGVAGNGPAFGATDSATTSTAGVTTKIVFDTELFDTDNAFDGSKFQPSVAGYYIVTARTANGVNTNAGQVAINIYKNGASVNVASSVYYGATWGVAPTISVILHFNGSTDYVEFYGVNNGNANLGFSYATAALVRAV